MLMALRIDMSGPLDLDAEPGADQQPRPVFVEAALFKDNASEVMHLEALVRPNGWRVPPPYAQAAAERYGCRAEAPLPLLTDMAAAAGSLLCRGEAQTDGALQVWRHYCGAASPKWLRRSVRVIDLEARCRAEPRASLKQLLEAHFADAPAVSA